MVRNTSLTSACESSLLNISSWRKPIWVYVLFAELPPMRRNPFAVVVPIVAPNGVTLPSWAYMFPFVDRPTRVLGIRYSLTVFLM